MNNNAPMRTWTRDFDITTIPDDVLLAESAKRLRARQGEGPRPKVLRQCEYCQRSFGAREIRKHLPRCPKRKKAVEHSRANWTLQKVTDTKEQQRETYRYWQSRPISERLSAIGEVTEAAYSIQRIR
jgi:hypothetical protein